MDCLPLVCCLPNFPAWMPQDSSRTYLWYTAGTGHVETEG